VSQPKFAQRMLSLRIMHPGLAAGPLLFAAAAWMMRPEEGWSRTENDAFLSMAAYISAALLILGFGMSFAAPTFLLRKMRNRVQGDAGIAFAVYQTVKIIQWALVEGPALFAGVLFYLTGELAALGACVILSVYLLAALGPSKAQIAKFFSIPEHEFR